MSEFRPLMQGSDQSWAWRWPDVDNMRFPSDTVRIVYATLKRVQEQRGQGAWLMQDELYKQCAYALDLNPDNVMESDHNKARIRKAVNWLIDQHLVGKTTRKINHWPYSQAAYRAKLRWMEVVGTVTSINDEGDMMTIESADRIYMRWIGHDWSFVNETDDVEDEDGNVEVLGKRIRFYTSREEQEKYLYA